jgi:hypothetical protein
MPSRPSHGRRPDGNSRQGNELGRHSGSAPRSQNSSYEDSTAGHSNQGAANSRASDGQQPSGRDRSDTEDDVPGGPGSRKRKLNQAILEYSMASKKSKSDSKYALFLFFTSIDLSSLIGSRMSANFVTGRVACFDLSAHIYTYGRSLVGDVDWPLHR